MAYLEKLPWREQLADPRFRTIFFLGVASGLPSSLVFATLSIWLREEGVSRTSIGLIGVAATPYAINFLWAPFVDRLRLGFLHRLLGQRRSWILVCQVLLFPSILVMGIQEPGTATLLIGLSALAVSVLSATQDVAIDAYRVEILEPREYGAGAAIAIYGWHTGAFITGAGALYVAAFGGWTMAYLASAVIVWLVSIATLLAREPERPAVAFAPARNIVDWLRQAAIAPLTDFFARLGWLAALILLLIIFFKFGDAMLGRMAGVFYVDLGFTKIEIANYTKTVGLFATLLGVGIGGWICIRIGIMRAMFLGALMMMTTNLAFALLASSGKNFELLAAVVFFDNLTGGMATTAFVAYLSSLCNVAFTATQYALLASLGNFARIQLGSVSGWAVDKLGGDWTLFFVFVATMSIPAILMLLLLARQMSNAQHRKKENQN
ncbi:MAG: hypothetical protein CFH41_01313 [Alphaproteobacteria bacterium MarineAlpha11_Bin1]|nr:MAG: hypothetical protein CFH41_01313 [Alphaproteobacteria bacterium MarineAlpha11_Bin1]|tara:strand:+ start:2732 stop:4039 length:1308 start_codon:yes stop_codon:yes gene_type:complete